DRVVGGNLHQAEAGMVRALARELGVERDPGDAAQARAKLRQRRGLVYQGNLHALSVSAGARASQRCGSCAARAALLQSHACRSMPLARVSIASAFTPSAAATVRRARGAR